MSPPTIHLIEKLSTRDIEKLTELLRLPPGDLPNQYWLQDQALRVYDLPTRLTRPNTGLLAFAMSLKVGPDQAKLCKSHKNLDPYLIRRIFLQVGAECTTRLTRLFQNRYLSTNIDRHVKRLQILNSLWISPELYRASFQVPSEEPRFFRILSDCEACILAAIGGNPHTLCDLRASILGRKKKRGKEARILRLVEAWIKWTGFGPQLLAESDALAREVRACRRDMQLARRQTKRNMEEGIPVESPEHFFAGDASNESTLVAEHGSEAVFEMPDNVEVEEDDDTVSGIINHYADSIRSSAPLLKHPAREDDLHPAYRRATRPQTQPSGPMSTSYASITTMTPNRLSEANLERLNDFPPRPERPQNQSTYMDSTYSVGMSRASAVVPPLRPRFEPAYTESAYSRDIYGRQQTDAESVEEVQERTYSDWLRRQEEEFAAEGNAQGLNVDEDENYLAPPIPRRSEYRSHPLPRPNQDGW